MRFADVPKMAAAPKASSGQILSIAKDGWYEGSVTKVYPIIAWDEWKTGKQAKDFNPEHDTLRGFRILFRVEHTRAAEYIGSTLSCKFYYKMENKEDPGTYYNPRKGSPKAIQLGNLLLSIYQGAPEEIDSKEGIGYIIDSLPGEQLVVKLGYSFYGKSKYPDTLWVNGLCASKDVVIEEGNMKIPGQESIEVASEAPANARDILVKNAQMIRKASGGTTANADDDDETEGDAIPF